ncbi:MAG: DUF3298 and DUF4163 domain-containing protein [Clostridium sp.]
MKRVISVFLPIIMNFTLIKSYPQMLELECFIHSVNRVGVVDKVINERDKYLVVDVKYPHLIGSKDKSGEEILNKKIEMWTIEWIDDIKLIVKEYYGDKLPAPKFPFEAKSIYEVKNNKNNLVSLYVEYYQYTGGAHGLTTRIPYTFNCRTGEMLSIQQLFKENYDFKTAINNEITKQIADEKDKYFEDENGFKGIKDNQSFYLEDENLVILFGLYEIAPYAAGIIEFRIPFKAFDNGLNYDKIT